jgi:hypothetical protein
MISFATPGAATGHVAFGADSNEVSEEGFATARPLCLCERDRSAHGARVDAERARDRPQGVAFAQHRSSAIRVDMVTPRPSEVATLRLRSPDPCDDAFTDEVTLELRDRRQHVEKACSRPDRPSGTALVATASVRDGT